MPSAICNDPQDLKEKLWSTLHSKNYPVIKINIYHQDQVENNIRF